MQTIDAERNKKTKDSKHQNIPSTKYHLNANINRKTELTFTQDPINNLKGLQHTWQSKR